MITFSNIPYTTTLAILVYLPIYIKVSSFTITYFMDEASKHHRHACHRSPTHPNSKSLSAYYYHPYLHHTYTYHIPSKQVHSSYILRCRSCLLIQNLLQTLPGWVHGTALEPDHPSTSARR